MFKTVLQLIIVVLFPLAVLAEPTIPFTLPVRSELLKLRSAIIETSQGDIVVELFPEDAPWHVANFKYLSDKGYYRGLSFHIFYPGYIIQGGASQRNPNGGPGYSLPPEFNRHRHERGALGMARRPDAANPERLSSGSQFHILLADAPHMNSAYTVFGRVIRGMDTVDRLRVGDTIRDIKVFVRD